ncbi:hypothetical protein F4806DRAFT_490960 [Annulohypoxylon nitens]|nr:hypothetical protein F4806DRAFT_490960 [Annulohypoxylon nitens]
MILATVTVAIITAIGAMGLIVGFVVLGVYCLNGLYEAYREYRESSNEEDIELGVVVDDFIDGGNTYRGERSDHTHEAYNATSTDDGNPPPPYDPSWAPTLQLAPRRASSPLLPLWSPPSPLSVPPRPASA